MPELRAKPQIFDDCHNHVKEIQSNKIIHIAVTFPSQAAG